MHKDDLNNFRKNIREVFRKVRVMNNQLNEGSYQKLEGEMRVCATKLTAIADDLNAIIEQRDSNA
ncbi:ABC transporter ATP-binding protein [Salmonella enterica subsp. diarizonae]|nr:ABC transporter ATP-binding protein [Salmonella enterica subsp. diarizonae]